MEGTARVRIDGGVWGGWTPPTSTFQTHYFSKNIDLIDKKPCSTPHLTFWQFDHWAQRSSRYIVECEQQRPGQQLLEQQWQHQEQQHQGQQHQGQVQQQQQQQIKPNRVDYGIWYKLWVDVYKTIKRSVPGRGGCNFEENNCILYCRVSDKPCLCSIRRNWGQPRGRQMQIN